MEKSFKKNVILALFIVFLIFLIYFFGTYSYFQKEKGHYHVDNNILSVRFDTTDINHLPVSDVIGKSFNGRGTEDGIQGYVEFSITNTGSQKTKYEIFSTKQVVSADEIKDNYLKFYLTDDKNVPVRGFERHLIPTYNDFPCLSDKPSSKLLYEGVLAGGASDHFILRIWVSDSYTISSILEEFKVDIDVRVK